MINKDTIAAQWKLNPNKIYYIIQNPRIDSKAKKMVGLTIKSVEYMVKDLDNEEIRFEKVNKDNDKRYPEILVFDKRYPDAENEVYATRLTKAKAKKEVFDSYAIFGDKKLAKYHKLIRLHRIAEQMVGIYTAMKGQQETPELNDSDDKVTVEAKKGVDVKKVTFTLDEVKNYFDAIQETNYYEELEYIQSENPDLAVK